MAKKTAWCVHMGWERSPVALRMSERIRADPLDTDAWRILLAEAARQPPADFRPVFEAAVTAMPEASAAWMGWAEAELGASEVEQAEAVFELCLLRLPQLPLWHLFLKFVREHKVAQLERSAARAQLVPALELLLEAVGADPSAGPLWTEYVSLTAAAEAGAEADGALVSAAELSATRKAYQAALTSCAAGLDGLLREYEAWETRTSGSQAKAMMHDTLEKAAAARKACSAASRCRCPAPPGRGLDVSWSLPAGVARAARAVRAAARRCRRGARASAHLRGDAAA